MIAFRKKHPDGKFIIVVPTTALLDQWYVSLQEDLGVAPHEIASYSSEEKGREPNVVNLLVLNTARDLAPAIAARYDTCLIVDECHRAGSPVNARALNGAHQAVLGLSATPKRDYDEGFEQYVVPALGDVIYTYDYTDAYKDGIITPFALTNVRVSLLTDEQEEYDRLSKLIARQLHKLGDLEGPSDRLKRLLQQRAAVSAAATMRVPVAARLVENHKGQRTIVFHERVDKADKLQGILVKRHHSATVYHSGIAPPVRRDNLRLYRRGVFDILISCRALDEGTNVPETVIAIIASSTASTRQRIQRLGRVLRPAPGKTMATIYTLYATDKEEQRLMREAEELEGITSVMWQRGTINKHG